MLSLRNATEADLGEIRRIYEYAQDYMIRSGNPTQWGRPAAVQRLTGISGSSVRPPFFSVSGDKKFHRTFIVRWMKTENH